MYDGESPLPNGDLTPDCRIIEFPVTGMQSKSLVLGGDLVRVYDETGHVQNGTTDFVKNGSFSIGGSIGRRTPCSSRARASSSSTG